MIHNKVLQFKGWILVILAMENIVVLSDILLIVGLTYYSGCDLQDFLVGVACMASFLVYSDFGLELKTFKFELKCSLAINSGQD